jgi:hypothetical protein
MGGIYDDQQYKNLMNGNYYPLENMKRSVARLKASKQIDIETMEYGQYQPILSPLDTWPKGSGKVWFKALGHARLQLTAQPNTTPLSNESWSRRRNARCWMHRSANVSTRSRRSR